MAKIVIVMVILASVSIVKAAPVSADTMVEDMLGFNIEEMVDKAVDDAKAATKVSIESGEGSSVGTILTSNVETVIENGEPVEKFVTHFLINDNGHVYKGVV